MIERVKRGQLDGVASGGMMCQRLAPTMRVVRVVGLFQSREEALYVHRPADAAARRGVRGRPASPTSARRASAATSSSRARRCAPSTSCERARLWVWDLDDVFRAELPAMGMQRDAAAVEARWRAFESGKLDGFIGIPSAALAFQWSTRARYFSDLRVELPHGLPGRGADGVRSAAASRIRRPVRAAAGKLMRHMEDMGQQQDDALVGSLFEKQGMHRVEVSQELSHRVSRRGARGAAQARHAR